MGFLQGSNALAAGKVKLGSTDIDKIYSGSDLIWPPTPTPAPSPTNYLYLQPNNVTISAYPAAVTGQSYSFLGQTYTVVDNAGLTAAKTNGDDLSLVVTTRVTDIQINGYDPVFNDNIGSWDVSNVTNLNSVFSGLVAFNQDISYWDVSNVTIMELTFLNAQSFNQPLNSWNVSNVTSFEGMFSSAQAFNQPLNSWNFPVATNLSLMFSGASAFNQNINIWNVSNVTSLQNTFQNTQSFNQPLNSWNTINVLNMRGLFRFSAFNQDISAWDVDNVSDMTYMFENNTAFNQDLSGWCVTLIPSVPTNFATGATAWILPQPVWGTCPGATFSGGFFDGVYYNLVTSPTTGRTWLDRNLGASQIATSPTDSNSYGWYFQWGRKADGHQLQTSTSTFGTQTRATNPEVTTNQIYWSTGSPYDWDATQNTTRWQVGGINNPCPPGFRLPTINELTAESAAWSSYNDAFNGFLKLPTAGSRADAGNFAFQGQRGYIASATEYQLSYSNQLSWSASGGVVTSGNNARSLFPVRPIKI